LENDISVDVRLSSGMSLTNTMSEGLIQVENNSFTDARLCKWEVNIAVLHFFHINVVEILKKIDRLENMDGELSEDGTFQFLATQR
jgi:hypothetical protein